MAHPQHASIVVTFHREGVLGHKTLLALARCRRAAQARGHTVQFVLTLDRADEETRRIVREHPSLQAGDVIEDIDYGDLGLSRNHAVRAAGGDWIGICDGDDYLSENWIVRCLESAQTAGARTIWHPELIVLFDGWHAISRQYGQDDETFDRHAMLVVNPWNSCSFAHRDVYLAVPYELARPGETGFGFEDWHWNCETLAKGYHHAIAVRTLHYVRRKQSGSLNQAHARASALIHRTALFDGDR